MSFVCTYMCSVPGKALDLMQPWMALKYLFLPPKYQDDYSTRPNTMLPQLICMHRASKVQRVKVTFLKSHSHLKPGKLRLGKGHTKSNCHFHS